MVNLKEIIKVSRENDLKEFDKKAHYTNTDMGKKMIIYSTKTLSTRDVDNWGRQEDEDMYIGLNKNGWIIYTHKIQFCTYEPKIMEKNTKSVDDEWLYNYLKSEECDNKEFLMFMSSAFGAYR